ncbi:MAG: helix-turn-helix transcriptional regulator [Paludibacteraceae bacterium]|nr:helix-turn-helix transcriptional regulator [Paludibacteraceae bacterium]
MDILIFYAISSVLLLMLLCIFFYMTFASRKLKNKRFQFRRHSFMAFYALLALTTAANVHIIHNGNVEILSTNPMCWEYITFVTFTLLSIAHFGADYYKNPYIWFLLLQYAVIYITCNIFTQVLGFYKPMCSYNELAYSDNIIGGFFVVREILTIIIISCYVFMIYMLIRSYIRCFKKKKEVSVEVRRRRADEAVNIFTYTGIMLLSMAAYFAESLWLHNISNVLFGVMLFRTYYVYDRFRKICLQKSYEKQPSEIIQENLEALLLREKNNPIFRPKANISDIANALKVSNESFSTYLYKDLNMSFSAWVSEKKLLKCVRLLTTTEMTITEVALASGYKDIQSMSKAFKLRFDKSPREFRKSLDK